MVLALDKQLRHEQLQRNVPANILTNSMRYHTVSIIHFNYWFSGDEFLFYADGYERKHSSMNIMISVMKNKMVSTRSIIFTFKNTMYEYPSID